MECCKKNINNKTNIIILNNNIMQSTKIINFNNDIDIVKEREDYLFKFDVYAKIIDDIDKNSSLRKEVNNVKIK